MNQTPFLARIEQPRSLVMRLAYADSRRRFGKVLTVLQVIYARVPSLGLLARKILQTQEKLSLETELRYLVQVKVSQLNGCAFCEDIGLAYALQNRIGIERFRALDDFQNSDAFSPREKASLAFCEEATSNRKVSTTTWLQVRAHFDETEIVELAWLNAAENYFNLQAAVLGIESDELAASAKS